jgi:hypothetical protein
MDVCQAWFSGIIQSVCDILYWHYVNAYACQGPFDFASLDKFGTGRAGSTLTMITSLLFY